MSLTANICILIIKRKKGVANSFLPKWAVTRIHLFELVMYFVQLNDKPKKGEMSRDGAKFLFRDGYWNK